MDSANGLLYTNPERLPPPVGRYSNVAIARSGSDTVYVAGQLPVGESGSVIAPGDFAAQADAVFATLRTCLEHAGSGLHHLTLLRSYLVREQDWNEFRLARDRAYASAGVDVPPPATTVVVAQLYDGALIELDAVAIRP